jgi:hypothetical protein
MAYLMRMSCWLHGASLCGRNYKAGNFVACGVSLVLGAGLKPPSLLVMDSVAKNVNVSFLLRLLKRVFKEKEGLKLFFTSRNMTIDIALQSTVVISQRKFPIERYVRLFTMEL